MAIDKLILNFVEKLKWPRIDKTLEIDEERRKYIFLVIKMSYEALILNEAWHLFTDK